jgi:hypothetical protein
VPKTLVPLITWIAPPVAIPTPALTMMLPPTLAAADESPATTDTMPPVPLLPAPTLNKIAPPGPTDATPLLNVKAPELPLVAVPLPKLNDPEAPLVPAPALLIATLPLDFAVPKPEINDNAPPVVSLD